MTKERTAELLNIESISLTYPRLDSHTLERPHLTHQVTAQFRNGADVVLVGSEPQGGKTTFLAQYARSIWPDVAYLRVPSLQGSALDSSLILYELANQISYYLNGVLLPDDINISGSDLRNLNKRLLRACTYSRKNFHFVIDGMENFRGKESEPLSALLGSIPFGYRVFRYLISGSIDLFPSPYQRTMKFSQVDLSPFSPSESEVFLQHLKLDEADEDRIYRITHGNPGYLSIVARHVEAGTSIDEILTLNLRTLPDFLDLQWGPVGELSAETLEWIAAVAFLPHIRTVDRLAGLFDIASERIRSALQATNLFELTDGGIRFRSEAMALYARRRLDGCKKTVLRRAVEVLQTAPLSNESLRYLPSYLRESGDRSAALAYLSPSTIFAALTTTGSVLASIVLSKEALVLARQAGAPDSIVEYASIVCLFRSLLVSAARPQELRALVAVKDDESARQLIDAAFSIEERCKLFSVYAIQKSEGGEALSDDLKQEIETTIKKFEPRELTTVVLDLIGDLIVTLPDVAMDLLRRTLAHGTDANSLDWALAYLTNQAIAAKAPTEVRYDLLSQLSDAFNTDFAKKVKGLGPTLVGGQRTDAFVRSLENLEKTEERVFLARIWITRARDKESAAKVAITVINQMIKDTSYSPNASVYLDFASPLDGSRKSTVMDELIGLIDAQGPLIRRLGPTVDYFRLRAHLIRYRYASSPESAVDALLRESDAIEKYDDVSVKAAAFASLYATILTIDHGGRFQKEWDLLNFIRQPLRMASNETLDQTALQSDSMLPIVQAIATVDLDEAIEQIKKVNTLPRRDRLYSEAIFSNVGACASDLDKLLRLKTASVTVQVVESEWVRSSLAGRLAGELLHLLSTSPHRSEMDQETCRKIVDDLIKYIREAPVAATVNARTYAALCNIEGDSVSSVYLDCARLWLEQLEQGALRQDVACDVATAIAPIRIEEAKRILRENIKPAKDKRIFDFFPEDAFKIANLVVRAFASLARLSIYEELTFEKVRAIIEETETVYGQIRLWTQLVLRVVEDNKSLATQITRDYIRPLLKASPEDMRVDRHMYEQVIIDAFPALWLATPAVAGTFLADLSWDNRDIACWHTAEYLLRGRIPGEPFEGPTIPTKRLDEETITQSIELARHIRADNGAFILLLTIFRYLRDRNSSHLSRAQKLQLIDQIQSLARDKFPASGFIQHEGYVILSDSWIGALRRENAEFFEQLLERAKQVPNASDRAFVFSQLLESVPTRFQSIRTSIKSLALELYDQVASVQERWNRIESLCEALKDEDPAICKQLMERAFKSVSNEPRADVDHARALVDLAYTIDKEWARSLASILDDDPAKQINRRTVTRHGNLIELRQKLINGKDIEVELKDEQDEDLIAEAARRAVARIHGYRAVAITPQSLQELVVYASKRSFSGSFPIWAFFIEAMATQYRTKDQVTRFIGPVLSKLMSTFQLYVQAACAHSPISRISDTSLHDRVERSKQTLVIGEGKRGEAIGWINEWLKSTDGGSIVIVEPYLTSFAASEIVEMFKLVWDEGNFSQITVLASLLRTSAEQFQDNVYRAWQSTYGDIEIPPIEVVFASLEGDGRCPVHDRWWIAESGVLTLGTSYNGLGKRQAEMSVQPREVAQDKLRKLDGFLSRRRKQHNGELIRYVTITL